MNQGYTDSQGFVTYEFSDQGQPPMQRRKLTVSEWEKMRASWKKFGLPEVPRPTGLIDDTGGQPIAKE